MTERKISEEEESDTVPSQIVTVALGRYALNAEDFAGLAKYKGRVLGENALQFSTPHGGVRGTREANPPTRTKADKTKNKAKRASRRRNRRGNR